MTRVSCQSSENDQQSRLFMPLLIIFMLCYLSFGGLIFSQVEGPQEVKDLKALEVALVNLSVRYDLSVENLTDILEHYDVITKNGYTISDLRNEHAHARKWNYMGAFIFSGTVVTTMGFGIATPNSKAARLLFIAYSLVGCPSAFLFFNTCLARFIKYYTATVNWIRQKKHRKLSRERNARTQYSVSPSHALVALFSLTLLILTMTSLIYTFTESDWDFVTSFYYCFTAASTIGFGDLVSGQDHEYDTINRYIYHVIDGIMVTMGCCSVYALFNMTSLFVKKFIDCVIIRLKRIVYVPSQIPDEDCHNGKAFKYDEINGVPIPVKRRRSLTVSVRECESFVLRDVTEERRIDAGEPLDPISEEETDQNSSQMSALAFASNRRRSTVFQTQRRSGSRQTKRNRSIRSARKRSEIYKKEQLGNDYRERIFKKTNRRSEANRTLVTDSFKVREMMRRNSDPIIFSSSPEFGEPWRMSQSVRSDNRSIRTSLGSERESTGWEESEDVFPLSILSSKMKS